ncbi:MAG: hypothetical protein Q8P67_25380 [archaeon]|nr:hypothetical protein [archaeon]
MAAQPTDSHDKKLQHTVTKLFRAFGQHSAKPNTKDRNPDTLRVYCGAMIPFFQEYKKKLNGRRKENQRRQRLKRGGGREHNMRKEEKEETIVDRTYQMILDWNPQTHKGRGPIPPWRWRIQWPQRVPLSQVASLYLKNPKYPNAHTARKEKGKRIQEEKRRKEKSDLSKNY